MVWPGQSLIVTVPPVTTAAARNGAALTTSGSTASVPGLIGPGWTRQVSAASPPLPGWSRPVLAVSTSAPAARSIWTVISMCGAEGTRGPRWRTSTPLS